MPEYPGAPDRFPGVERLSIQNYLTGGTSPRSGVLPALPGYGVWLVNVTAWAGNQNQSILVPAVIAWWENDLSGGSAKLASYSTLIGTPVRAGGDSTTDSLTLSAPDTNGVITATVGWNDGGSKTPHVRIEGVRLTGPTQFVGG